MMLKHNALILPALIAVAIAAHVVSVSAAPPQYLISYQGIILDGDGVPVAGPVDLELKLFDVPVGGTELWSEIHNPVILTNGVFDVYLGGRRINSPQSLTPRCGWRPTPMRS